MDIPYLTSLVIFLPTVGALLTLFMREVSSIRWTALATTTLTFVLSIGLFVGYDPSVSTAIAPQLADVSSAWFPETFDVKYFVGIDGLSLLLVMLTTLLGPIVVLSSWTYITKKQKGYYALLLLLQTGITGVFTSFDLFLFYIFFELTLIPMYFIIGVWGGKDRIYAAVKFVIYTLVGSLLMLVAILFLGYEAGAAVNNGVFTTDWYKLLEYNVPLATQGWLFALFAFSFAIKVPLFPLHTWLPDAHVQAPTGGSVILAGVLLKMGTYGLLRFCLPFFPNAAQSGALLIGILAVIGIIYGALIARVQDDAKSLVAYSSVSHLGFVVLGLFAFTTEAMQGAVIQMVNHGLSTGALFLLVGMLYERRHTRLMDDYGGLAASVPVLTTLMVFSVLASAGMPGLNGFVGEFLILLGSFKSTVLDSTVLVVFATTGVILAAVYLLHMVYRTFFGELDHEANANMADVNGRELLLMAPLVVLMFVMGFFPNPFLRQTQPTTEFLLETIEEKQAAALEQAEPSDPTAELPAAPPEMDEVTIDAEKLKMQP
ncbi:NADH dehydrogenase [Salinibacter sp. 10B]|uniref:complex I subunit 4 family protein n=1 Tax=Salinibacter sp. 10B TaxID=1923971 RepID=UPI000CF39300|nr:NADH-quinone oxidoreductase subunit M [Salinibacter sp. 10B]PQJ33420.1 NADH dehydrogenase [Salinibacter sp. 10B]